MREVELANNKIFKIPNETQEGILNISVIQVLEFILYEEKTLNEVFEEIDENPDWYDDIDVEEILSEIDVEEDYEDFIEQNLGNDHKRFVELFLEKLNENLLQEYDENVIIGEESFYTVISYQDEESNDVNFEKLNQLKQQVLDENDLLGNVLENRDDIFYVIQLNTSFKD